MKEFLVIFLKKLTSILEFFIALMLALGIILLCARMFLSLINIPDLNVWPNYDDLLETCFNLIIGVELIRMMYSHTANTVFEVLLFAIARQIIVDHSSVWSSFIGVCAIAALFATRRFLFCEFSASDETIFRAGIRMRVVNRLLGLDIPCAKTDTLLDVFAGAQTEGGGPDGEDGIVTVSGCRMRVVGRSGDKITKIEVIRPIR